MWEYLQCAYTSACMCLLYTYLCMGSAQVHTSVYRMCTHPPLSGGIFLRGALGGYIAPTGAQMHAI